MGILNFKTFTELSKKKPAFEIKLERIKTKEENNRFYDKHQDLFFFYVRIYIDIRESSPEYYSLEDVELVKYKLHETFPDRIRISDERKNGFELKIWTYGFFEVETSIFLKHGKSTTIHGKVKFDVTLEEIQKNGAEELSI